MVIEKWSPVTGEKLGEFPIASAEEVEEAVARARAAAPGWRETPLERRLELLMNMALEVSLQNRYIILT